MWLLLLPLPLMLPFFMFLLVLLLLLFLLLPACCSCCLGLRFDHPGGCRCNAVRQRTLPWRLPHRGHKSDGTLSEHPLNQIAETRKSHPSPVDPPNSVSEKPPVPCPPVPSNGDTVINTLMSSPPRAFCVRVCVSFFYFNDKLHSWDVTHSSSDLQKGWEGLEAGTEDEEAEVSVAGRIMARRVFGKLAFFSMQAITNPPSFCLFCTVI